MTKFQPLSEIVSKPVDWAIRPLIARGEMLYLVGHGGQGKSTLLCDLAGSIADSFYRSCLPEDALERCKAEWPSPWPDGLCAGGTLQTYPDLSPIAIVDGENSARVWQRLMSKTLATYGINPQSTYAQRILEQVHHVRSSEYDLHSSKDRRIHNQALFLDIERQGFRTLIIDPVWKVYSPPDAGDPSWVTEGISYLRDLCIDAGITVLVAGHPAADHDKRDQARKVQPFGSSQQHGMYDALVYLKRSGSAGLLSLIKTRAQDWIQPGKKVRLEYGSRGGGYLPCKEPWPLTEPEDGIFLSDGAYSMLQLLPTGLFRIDQIPNVTPKTVRKYLQSELVPSLCVEHVQGKGVKGDPELFKITDTGKRHIKYKKSLANPPHKD